jgi:Ni/Co efflux regulator RcnB
VKQIATLTLLLALTATSSIATPADNPTASKTQTDKSAQKKQKALYDYQKKQAHVQQKAQRTADKQQRKATKKYEKQQRKMLKNSSLPAKHKS